MSEEHSTAAVTLAHSATFGVIFSYLDFLHSSLKSSRLPAMPCAFIPTDLSVSESTVSPRLQTAAREVRQVAEGRK